ncbi:MAG: hypothetical protein K1X53_08780 [Candidatus Sumerlaeaceae bacterium]|nr:hypothetical protein [Candidatus Sumerlaeaceae bacterium]
MIRKEYSTKKGILFIDTGDNCRCPMAKGYLSKLLHQKGITYIDIKTAGVMTPTGLLPTPEVVQLLQEEGSDIRGHRSRPLSDDLIRRADLVLGMTPFHVQTAFRLTEAARGKTFLLKEYAGREGKNVQIPDPMGGTLEIFKKVFSEIKASLQKLVEMEIITLPPAGAEIIVHEEPPAKPVIAEAKPKAKAPEKPAPVSSKPVEKPKAKPAKPAVKTAVKSKPAAKAKKAAPAKAKPAAKAKAKAKPAAKKAAKPVAKKAAKPVAKKKAAPKAAAKKAKPSKPAKKGRK